MAHLLEISVKKRSGPPGPEIVEVVQAGGSSVAVLICGSQHSAVACRDLLDPECNTMVPGEGINQDNAYMLAMYNGDLAAALTNGLERRLAAQGVQLQMPGQLREELRYEPPF